MQRQFDYKINSYILRRTINIMLQSCLRNLKAFLRYTYY